MATASTTEQAGAVIRSQDKGTAAGAWIFAVLWNAVSIPVLFQVPGELEKGNTPALVGLIFPVIGAGLVLWALRATIRLSKFGVSALHLDSDQVSAGALLSGRMVAGLASPPELIRLQLTCVRRTRHSGRKSKTSERLLWEETVDVPGEMAERDSQRTIVPFRFAIPADAPPTERTGNTSIRWMLTASADVAGVDFLTRFEIPVQSSGRQPDAALPATNASAGTPQAPRPASLSPAAFDPADSRVIIGPGPQGGTEFRHNAPQAAGPGLIWLVFAVLFWAATVFLSRMGAPTLFPLVFGGFALLISLIAIDLLLGSTTLEIAGDVLVFRHSLLGFGRSLRLARSSIAGVRVAIGMTQNQTMTQSARAWYDVEVLLQAGRSRKLLRRLPSKAEAEWLAGQLRDLLQLQAAART